MRKQVMIILCFVATAWSAKGQGTAVQGAQSMSLTEAISYAKANNPGLKNAKLDIEKAKSVIDEVRAIGLPQVNGSLQFLDNVKIGKTFLDAAAFNPSIPKGTQYIGAAFGLQYGIQNTISASQLVFDGSYIIGLKASSEVMRLNQQLYAKTELDAEINVTKAYYQVLTLSENIKLMDNNISRVEKLFAEISALAKSGFAESLDADRLELTLSNLNIQKKNLVNLNEVTLKLLKLQMGMDVATEITLTDNIESLYKEVGEDLSALEFSVANRIEYKLVQQNQKLNQLDKQRWQYSYLPNLALFGSYNYNLSRPGDKLFKTTPQLPWVESYLVGFKLSVPIFDGFQKNSKIRQANIAIQKTNNDLFNLSNALNVEASSARSKYILASEMLQQQKKNLKLAEKIYTTVSIKYKEGVGTSLELQTADSDLKTAQGNYINAISDLLNAKADLKKALGNK
jgi:outer membrane protein TolC